ncbi:MAG: hypothetical protein HFJ36_05300 [Clostridia bacterium]|nr:hypothetical protein [Clostridia bacterium]
MFAFIVSPIFKIVNTFYEHFFIFIHNLSQLCPNAKWAIQCLSQICPS